MEGEKEGGREGRGRERERERERLTLHGVRKANTTLYINFEISKYH